jgi:hypothetical protein
LSDRRPNRAHGAIDDLPPEIQLLIRDWYVGRFEEDIPRLTYEQISDRLKDLGHQISKSQVHRWIARQRNELERIETARERAQALAKYLVPDGTDVEQAAVALTGALCLEALADADVQQVKSISDLARVARALGNIQRSSVGREQWEQEKGKRIEAAMAELKDGVKAELEGEPELIHRLLDVAARAQKKMLEKIA